jgi:hypothetical protein
MRLSLFDAVCRPMLSTSATCAAVKPLGHRCNTAISSATQVLID